MTDVVTPIFQQATGAVQPVIKAAKSLTTTLPLVGRVGLDDVLSGGATAFGALENIRAGQAAAAATETEARFESFRAGQEMTAGQQEQNAIREKLLRTLAQNRAAAGASGITLDSGSVDTVINESINAANRELEISRQNATIAASARQSRADQLRLSAQSARAGGVGRAAFGLLDAVYRSKRRGKLPEVGADG